MKPDEDCFYIVGNKIIPGTEKIKPANVISLFVTTGSKFIFNKNDCHKKFLCITPQYQNM